MIIIRFLILTGVFLEFGEKLGMIGITFEEFSINKLSSKDLNK
jgi:hypothetical protein